MAQELLDFIIKNSEEFNSALFRHLLLSFSSLIFSIIVFIPLGIGIHKNNKWVEKLMSLTEVGKMIPSFVILALMMPVFGIGFWTAFIALVILCSPHIFINTCNGLMEVDENILEAAKGVGMNRKQVLFKIKLPIALPVILEGVKTASVEVFASATLASIIGGGGLGDFIIGGLSSADNTLLLIGAVPVSIIAIVTALILELIIRKIRY